MSAQTFQNTVTKVTWTGNQDDVTEYITQTYLVTLVFKPGPNYVVTTLVDSLPQTTNIGGGSSFDTGSFYIFMVGGGGGGSSTSINGGNASGIVNTVIQYPPAKANPNKYSYLDDPTALDFEINVGGGGLVDTYGGISSIFIQKQGGSVILTASGGTVNTSLTSPGGAGAGGSQNSGVGGVGISYTPQTIITTTFSDTFEIGNSSLNNSIIPFYSSYGAGGNADTLPPSTLYPGNGGDYNLPGQDGITYIQYWWPPPITSDICFPAGTPVKTDQGLLPIEKLKPGINTINRNRIEHITRTITNDNYLVCFEKDSLDINLPIRRTLISKNHKILYKNKLIEAYKFINSFHGVHKVEYNGELLYNVLMDDYYTMDVNNLICETLHPTNVIAQIHNSSYSKEDKAKMLCQLKDLIKNKEKTFKKLGMPIGYKK